MQHNPAPTAPEVPNDGSAVIDEAPVIQCPSCKKTRDNFGDAGDGWLCTGCGVKFLRTRVGKNRWDVRYVE